MNEIVRAIHQRRRYRRPGVLRVVIVAESFVPAVNGVTNSVLRIAEQLTSHGHECIVVAPGPGPTVVDGVSVLRVRSFDLPRYGDLRVGLPTARLAAMFKRIQPDVVHLAAPAVLGASGALAARRVGVPSVAVYQTDLAGFARRQRLGVAHRPLWKWISWVHQRADLTLAPSTSAVWALRHHGVHNVALWARGVDLRRFHPLHRSDEWRRTLAPAGETIVGFVGRLAPEKQIGRLAATSARPDVRVVVVGDGPERDRLEAVMPRATFLGLRHGTELGALYASFDVFAHAGLDETFCQAVQEALASGLPVVAPASGGPLDLVRHGENGYLWNPADPASFSEAISELVGHPALRRRLGAAA
ncbi:MAG: glycosyltransferase family 1 protein, partial [Actinomycetota bacterium]